MEHFWQKTICRWSKCFMKMSIWTMVQGKTGRVPAEPSLPHWSGVLPAVPPQHLLDSLTGTTGSKGPMSPSSKVPNLYWSTWPWSEQESKLWAWCNKHLRPSLSVEDDVSCYMPCKSNHHNTCKSWIFVVLWNEETLFDVRRINSVTCNTWILKAGRIYEVLAISRSLASYLICI